MGHECAIWTGWVLIWVDQCLSNTRDPTRARPLLLEARISLIDALRKRYQRHMTQIYGLRVAVSSRAKELEKDNNIINA